MAVRATGWILALSLILSYQAPQLIAQGPFGGPNTLQLHRADMPPGSVGQGQLLRGGPLAGYFQPVSFTTPENALVEIWSGRKFEPVDSKTPLVGMLIGSVYRLRVTQIPAYPGEEIFPTIELVNRLYPPQGLAKKFPVPIHLTQEELEMALAGQFVTRVIYLENPNQALPAREIQGEQRVFQIGRYEDPLQTADAMGRPMAIIRIGSRLPLKNEFGHFGYGQPPYRILTPAKNTSRPNEGQAPDPTIERSARVPRIPQANSYR